VSWTSGAAGVADAFVAGRAALAPLTEAAFSDFYARTSGPLTGYLRRLTGSAAVAEDLAQEAYLRFLSVIRLPETDEHRKNYLFRIGTNLARDHFRAERRDRGYAESARRVEPPTSIAVDDNAGVLDPILARLSPRDRELLLLAYVQGMTHQEIAGVTGLMRASVKPLLFRARHRFASALRAAGITPDSTTGGAW
jgi:RNA polymerase sigma-70 factor (ECF subfamily)